MSPLWLAVIFSSLWLGVGYAVRAWLGEPKHPHQSPHLHEGPFRLVSGDHDLLVHERELHHTAVPDCKKNGHQVQQCTITEGLAHIDRCYCGAERYGRYGAWA